LTGEPAARGTDQRYIKEHSSGETAIIVLARRALLHCTFSEQNDDNEEQQSSAP
jgi:hypothetical protein